MNFDKLLHKSYKDKIERLVTRADEEAYNTLMDVVESDFGAVWAQMTWVMVNEAVPVSFTGF